MEDDPLYQKAFNKTLRYLAYRGRSIAEVRNKLEVQGFEGPVIKKVIDRLCDLGYLNDRNFALQWTRSLAAGRLWGDRKIEGRLLEKGISRDLIQDALAEARGEKDERHSIKELIEKRLRKEPAHEVLSYKGKRRLIQALVGRGFTLGVILEVLREMGDTYNDRQ